MRWPQAGDADARVEPKREESRGLLHRHAQRGWLRKLRAGDSLAAQDRATRTMADNTGWTQAPEGQAAKH